MIGCCSSAHYFWYIIQTACHAYRRNTVQYDGRFNPDLSDFLVLFVNSKMIVKRIYRIIVTLLTIGHMIYHAKGDFWSMFINPAGEVPLMLMWGLNITHLIGLLCFVMFSLWSSARQTFTPPTPDVAERENLRLNQPWKMIISMIILQVSVQTIDDFRNHLERSSQDCYSSDISTARCFTSNPLVCVVCFLVDYFRSNLATRKGTMYFDVSMLLYPVE